MRVEAGELGTVHDLTVQARDLPLDAHLHTDLSPDSDVPIDTYAAQAVERGIAELAITDHVDFEPGAPAFDFVPFDVRERTVREAAERWAPYGVAIRFGVEVTYDSRFEEAIRDHLRSHEYDYVIGSVHVYAGSPYARDRVAAWVSGRSLAETMAPHFDGTALEVNTSGLRQAAGETYPSAAVVARYQLLGGTRISAGSDAHQKDAFASGLEAGYGVVAAAGFRELAFRRGGERLAVSVPDRFRTRSGPNEAANPSL